MYGQMYGRTYGQTYGRTYGPIDRQMLKTWSLKQVSVKKILLWGAASVLSSQIQFAKLPRRNSVSTMVSNMQKLQQNSNKLNLSLSFLKMSIYGPQCSDGV
jgi:hypothetical protein